MFSKNINLILPNTSVLHLVLKLASTIGLLFHVFFFIFLALEEIYSLAIVNIFSIGIWVWIRHAVNRYQLKTAMSLLSFEVIAHAILAVSILSTKSGFHYYLWSLACLLSMNNFKHYTTGVFAGLVSIITFICLEVFFSDVVGMPLNDIELRMTNYVNILFAGISMVLVILFLRLKFEIQEKKLSDLANIDELTGLFNRRYLEYYLNKYHAKAMRENESYSIVMGDIDHFKTINDTYFHVTGDKVLAQLSKLLTDKMRSSDIVSRWGGEEFLILLPACHLSQAQILVEKLRRCIQDELKIKVDGTTIDITMSFGIASPSSLHETVEMVIHRADECLYQAKNNGRNCIITEAMLPHLSKMD